MGLRAVVTRVRDRARGESPLPVAAVCATRHSRADAVHAYPPRYLVAGRQRPGALSRWSGWTRASQPVVVVRAGNHRPR